MYLKLPQFSWDGAVEENVAGLDITFSASLQDTFEP